MKKIVIIGGGVAGLTAGIYGQLAGHDCTLIEKNSFVGGNLTGWERDGHAIDNCMHWLTGTHPRTKLFRLWKDVGILGEGVKLCHPAAFCSFEHHGQRISLWRDPKKTLDQMLKLSPEDSRESKRFIAAVRAFGQMQLSSVRTPTVLPHLLRYRSLSLGELSERFHHPLLRRMMTDFLAPELSALALIIAYSAFSVGNADLTYGGSKAAAERMRDRYLSLGGALLTDTEVETILMNGKRAVGVRLKDGTSLPCDTVISACDPFITFGRLLPESYMPERLRRAREDTLDTPLFSALHAAFSCDDSSEIPKNTVVIDAPTFDLDGRRISHLVLKPYTKELLGQPNSKAVLQVLIFLDDRESLRWIKHSRNPEAYRASKERFGRAIAQRILARYPSLRPSLKLLDVWTPASYVRYFGSTDGAFMGFAMKPGRALRYRLPSRIRGIKGLFLATQWQAIPGGLPQAALRAKQAIHALSPSRRKKQSNTTPQPAEA